jgi:predicted DsbA family dithiol-disulfide isomerase
MSKVLVVDYYSDILCIWAWIAQRRIDELNKSLGNSIEIHYHYMDVFGDTVNKISTQWREKGGYDGFAKHVFNSAAPYDDAIINPALWHNIRPASSATAHLVLKGIELALGKQASMSLALSFRKAFFIEAIDISQLDVLMALIDAKGFDSSLVNNALNDGTAMAALMLDYQHAKSQNLKGSPSYIIDNGRQVLYGNVGYRVLFANIEEQLKTPENEAVWC